METITIAQIARMAGVSKTTVSRVLNKKPDVNPKTRKRIEELIAKYDFNPNAYAKAVSGQKSNTVALVIPYDENYIFANPYYSEMIRGVSGAVKQRGYHLILTYSKNDDYVPMIKQKRADGLIIISPGKSHTEVIKKLKALEVPFVSTAEIPGMPDVHSILTDDFGGACDAMEYLVSLGHRKIGFISGPDILASSIDRQKGYRHILEKYGIPYEERFVVSGDTSAKSGYQAMERLIREKITAVFAGSDLMAIGAVSAIVKSGRRVPEDISVVGFDGLPITEYLNPPLTTVKQPTFEKGRKAAELLLDLIAGKEMKQNDVMPVKLVIRDSARKKGDNQ